MMEANLLEISVYQYLDDLVILRRISYIKYNGVANLHTAMTVYRYPVEPKVSSLTLATVPKQIPANSKII